MMKTTETKSCSHQLKTISIVGGFLDGLHFELSENLNCIIGARGTGKTTVLEFVRYAMDAMPSDPAAHKRVVSLVENNLAGGRIEVAVQTKDGLSYIISRSAGDEPVVLDENRNPTEIKLRSGGLFKVDIFSQNEVEDIADQSSSQLDLIDNFKIDRISNNQSRIRTLKADLNSNASKIIPLKQRAEAITGDLDALPGLEENLKAFTIEGGEDADEINHAHTLKSLRDREWRAIETSMGLLLDVKRTLDENIGSIDHRLATVFSEDMLQGPNGEVIQQICSGIGTCSDDVDRLLKQAATRTQSEIDAIEERAGQLDLSHKQQDQLFQNLIEKHKEVQGKAVERHRLEKLRNDLLAKKRDREQVMAELEGLNAERGRLLEQLSELCDERFRVRQAIVDQINESLSPTIRVTLMQFGNPEKYQQLLGEALKGGGLNHYQVADKIANVFWPAELADVIMNRNPQPLIDKAELNADQAGKVIATLSGSRIMFDLEVVEMVDLPKIELNDNGTFKETGSLSTGQKCTTILPILLMESDNPLLIDQPEDNLDNRFVYETIVVSIDRIKQRRQLIFVTHNPNIPVLGDAEQVFVLESDGTSATKVNEGTVDQCKDDIVTLLEGGEDAFKRRRDRYSY